MKKQHEAQSLGGKNHGGVVNNKARTRPCYVGWRAWTARQMPTYRFKKEAMVTVL